MAIKNEFEISLGIVLACLFGISILAFGHLPEKIVTHWGLAGEPNGYSDKTVGLIALPALTLVILAMLAFLPKIDPLHGIGKFQKEYNFFLVNFAVFMLYIHGLAIVFNLGIRFDFGQLLAPGFGLLFFSIGNVLEKSKRNWFAGIRTPWTLSSDSVWGKTHKLGGKMFKICAAISFLSVFGPGYALLLSFVPIIASCVYLAAYSYFEYKKEK